MKMKMLIYLFIMCFAKIRYATAASSSASSSSGDGVTQYESCKMSGLQSKFDVLPGRGWDNLQNKEMGQVLSLNFSECSFSQDNGFLLPNGVSLIPLKSSDVSLFSKFISHYSEYTSMTSNSINAGAEYGYTGFKISGSFSAEKTKIKKDQMETKSKLSIVHLKYRVFKSIVQPDTQLDKTFYNRIMEIATVLLTDKDDVYSQYLADLIVRDFGTHVIQTIDAGAILAKIDSLKSDYVKKYEKDTSLISASASASFAGTFSVGVHGGYSTKTSQTSIDEYNTNSMRTRVQTMGGSLFRANFTLNDWEQTVVKNLIPVDRSGVPIYDVITHGTLKELDATTLKKLYSLLKDAVHRYYKMNIVEGCMKLEDPNFNPDANIDSGHCKPPVVNFTLGGVYQTCSGPSSQCDSVTHANPLTGEFSCPSGFDSILLDTQLNRCETYCHSVWWFWRNCNTDCSYYKVYWCYPTRQMEPNHNGYQFGGFISKQMPHCPEGYISLPFGLSVQMCVTNDPLPNSDAMLFGGFYSCNVGNPLASKAVTNKLQSTQAVQSPWLNLKYWPKYCLNGFEAHIVTIERGCQISYCTKMKNNNPDVTLAPLNRPPFINFNFKPNITKPLIFSTMNGEQFVQTADKTWSLKSVKERQNRMLIGSIVGSIFIGIFVLVIGLFLHRKWQQRKMKKNVTDKNLVLNDNNTEESTYGAMNA